MIERSLQCPRCGGSLEAGFIPDQGRNSYAVAKWVRGAPEFGFWGNLKLRGKEQLNVTTYRCARCGYLEGYA